jgi:hypothetical protein
VDAQAMGEKENLAVETPGGHVPVEISDVRVFGHWLIEWLAVQLGADHFDQCGFANADIAGYRDKFLHFASQNWDFLVLI